MIVECENCGTKFKVDPDRIKDEGSKVRCSKCRHTFMLYRPDQEEPLAEKPGPEEVPAIEAEDDLGLGEAEALAEGSGLAEAEDDLGLGLPEDDLGLGEAKASAESPGLAEAEDDLGLGLPEDDLGLGEAEAEDDLGLGSLEADLGESPADEAVIAGDTPFSEDEMPGLGQGEPGLAEEGGPGMQDEPGPPADEEILGLGDEPDLFAEAVEPDLSMEEPEVGEDLDAEIEVPPKKKGRGFLWLLVILLFLTAVAAGVWLYAPDLLAPLGLPGQEAEVKDDPKGNMFISPVDARHFFRQNEKEGQILVITGLAKNQYKTARGFIRLKGLLHDSQGKILKEQTVYCGNILTEDELITLSMEDMTKRFKKRGGEKGLNMKVPPGGSVKFMIVFNQIPTELTEYTVEVFSSESAE